GLKVSVAGLGCGGSSRLGTTAGHSDAHAVGIVQKSLDLGVNFIDTAQFYGTEPIVGAALKGRDRASVVISTKHKVSRGATPMAAANLVTSLNASLKALRTDYIDLYCLHTVLPDDYNLVAAKMVPVLLREKEKGKIRHIGITEWAAHDHNHDMLERALTDDHWDAVMVAFHMLSQNARSRVFPATLKKNIGTLVMFAVRALFSVPGRLQQDVRALVAAGKLPQELAAKDNPLDFLLHDNGGAKNIIEAAYRYARHEPGANVVLFGTGNPDHVATNVNAILKPALPEADRRMIEQLFGALVGVGLDEPTLKKTAKPSGN
ncbi:MAG: aldo/keto reductase, partial [Burkholderiales bacterium]